MDSQLYRSDRPAAILRGCRPPAGPRPQQYPPVELTGQAARTVTLNFPIHKSREFRSKIELFPSLYYFFDNKPEKTSKNYTLTAQYRYVRIYDYKFQTGSHLGQYIRISKEKI
jgi:hypothetical protein